MATNILDSAKVLEQTIRESAEFIHLKQQYDNVYADEATKKNI